MKKFLTLFTALFMMGSMMVVQAVTYTPAGTPASVFGGTEWAPDNANNDMVLSNGLYVYAKQDNFASQTAISFKVCKDHGWTTAYPGSNYGFNIPAGSKYLIITYNTSGNAVNAFAISSMTVAGEPAALFGSTWAPTATANDMTLQNDGTYKFEKSGVALSAGTVNFKACANHAWTNAWPSNNYSLSIPESGNYTITITFDPATLSVSASADLEEAVVVIPNIQLHSNIKNPSWETTANFDIAGNNETASLTLTGVTKGNYEFGVKIDGTWTSNGAQFTRENNSHVVVAGSGDCSFNADRNGDYTFTWTYDTKTLEITYPDIPAQNVAFDGLATQTLKGSTINLANFVTSSGIDNPSYRFYIREKYGVYGDAIPASYTFNALGEYEVKVEALDDNIGEPVAFDETEIVVYDAYTFTNGTTIYVDYTAMTEGNKGVNYPFGYVSIYDPLDYDANGAGTVKTVTFTEDVQWTTLNDFIKTEKASWLGLRFSVPENGQNCAVVAADGLSYIWTTYAQAPATIRMYGDFNTPGTWLDTDDFTGNEESVSLKMNLVEGNYEFGVVIDDAFTVNGTAFTRDNTSAQITDGNQNMMLDADVDGEYTFTWTFASNTLSIDYPAAVTPEYATIKFFAPRDQTNKWDHVYAYATKGNKKDFGPKPGTEITDKDAEWYVVTVRKGSNLLFTDDYGMETTVIENIQENACYVSTGIDYSVTPKIVSLTKQCNVDYYVAGDAAIMGSWNEAYAPCKLDENNQVIFHDVPAGSYQFKITNGSWAWSIGGNDFLSDEPGCGNIAYTGDMGNTCFKIDEVQDVTITYYPATRKICLGALTVKTVGTLTASDINLYVDETKYPSYVTNIEGYTAADVELTFVSGDACVEFVEGQIKGTAEGTAVVRVTIAETALFTGAEATFNVTVSAAPVPPTPSEDWVEVRSGLEAGRHYTVCLENNVTAVKGATFWSLTYRNEGGTAAYLVEETAPFDAGKPYIFQATGDNDNKLEVVYGTETEINPVVNGALRGTFSYMDANALAAVEGTVYMLYNNALCPMGTDNHLDAHRAYVRYDLLTVPSTSNFAPGKRVKSMPMQGQTTTGIDALNASEAPVKMIIDGNLYILRGEKMYDATGRLVK